MIRGPLHTEVNQFGEYNKVLVLGKLPNTGQSGAETSGHETSQALSFEELEKLVTPTQPEQEVDDEK